MPRFDRTVTAHCSIRDTVAKLSMPKAEVLRHLKAQIEKRLGKQGVRVEWLDAAATPEVAINLTSIDEGNQLLRYLVPFAAPAVVSVEGRVALDGQPPQPFAKTQKAHFGVFGGSAKGMLQSCNVLVAKAVTKAVVRALKEEAGAAGR